MSTKFVIKRDSGGRPTEGGLRLPGRDASDQPDRPAKSIALKFGLHHTSEGRITKPNNPAKNRERHGNASLSRVPASRSRGVQGSSSKKSDEGILHDMSPLDKSLAPGAILEAHNKPVSEPSIEPNPTDSPGLGPSDPSGNCKSLDYHQIEVCDHVQSNAEAATPVIHPIQIPNSVQHGIVNDHSNSTDALIQSIHEENPFVSHSAFGYDESQGPHYGESAPPEADRNPFTGPAASFGL